MPVPTYICRNRHGAYCFRVVIPEILRRHFPNQQREIWRTLKTHKRQDAIRLARVYAVASDNLFQSLREGILAKDKPALHDIRQMLIGSDGSITLEGISIDPDKAEADKALLESAIQSATHASLKLRGSTTVSESLSPLLSEAIRSFCEEQERSKAWTSKTAGETPSR